MGGKSSLDYIYEAIDLAMAKKIDATVTGPIHKEAIRLGGCPYPGHTEVFAHRTQTEDYAMMLVEGKFRVVHVTTHVALKHVSSLIRKDRVLKVIKLAHRAMKDLGIENPRIIVPGFNPHASDGDSLEMKKRKKYSQLFKRQRKKASMLKDRFLRIQRLSS